MIPIERRDAAVGCWLKPGAPTPHGQTSPSVHELWPKKDSPQANEIFYISGPVSAEDIKTVEKNKRVFAGAQNMLLAAGCSVFNPIHVAWPIDPLDDESLWKYFMHFCVRAIPECDGMLMLPNWQNSKGAKWEHRIAEMLGLKICYSPVREE